MKMTTTMIEALAQLAQSHDTESVEKIVKSVEQDED